MGVDPDLFDHSYDKIQRCLGNAGQLSRLSGPVGTGSTPSPSASAPVASNLPTIGDLAATNTAPFPTGAPQYGANITFDVKAARACECSPRRLSTDVIDLYLLHWRGSVPLLESVAAFENLREAGKIWAWGV